MCGRYLSSKQLFCLLQYPISVFVASGWRVFKTKSVRSLLVFKIWILKDIWPLKTSLSSNVTLAIECGADFVYFSQFTEQERKLIEATTEFHQKVNGLVKISQPLYWLTLTPDWLVASDHCLLLLYDINRKLTLNMTIWRSARRWTSRWPPLKHS